MSGLISFKFESGDAWIKAGWAFRQVLEDTLATSPEDSEMAGAFEVAEGTGRLYVDQFEPDLSARITDAMRRMIEAILTGRSQSRLLSKAFGTSRSVEQYLDSLRELSQLMPPDER